jgi:uncharacterized protein YggE
MNRQHYAVGLLATCFGLLALGMVACGVGATPASFASSGVVPGSSTGDANSGTTAAAVVHGDTGTSVGTTTGNAPGQAVQEPSSVHGSVLGQIAPAGFDSIEVIGVGKSTGIPDVASLSLGVAVMADSVSDAKGEADASLQHVLDALSEQGVDDEDISTVHFSIHPEFDYSSDERRVIGYRVSNSLSVVVRDIDSVGSIIDASVEAGGDNLVFNGVSFSFTDTAAMEREAREAAVQDMQDKAAQLAEFSGRELGSLKKLSETGGGRSPFESREFGYGAALFALSDTAILVGDDDLTVWVYGVYELR